MATGWGVKIGEKVVRFDDLTPQAWQDIETASGVEWAVIYTAPMNKIAGALSAVVECVKVAEPNCDDPVVRANELGSTLGKLSDLFVPTDDDMPHTFSDGIPKEEGVNSTPPSSSS